jgi:hypothetical protein
MEVEVGRMMFIASWLNGCGTNVCKGLNYL